MLPSVPQTAREVRQHSPRGSRFPPLYPMTARCCSRQTGSITYDHYGRGRNPYKEQPVAQFPCAPLSAGTVCSGRPLFSAPAEEYNLTQDGPTSVTISNWGNSTSERYLPAIGSSSAPEPALLEVTSPRNVNMYPLLRMDPIMRRVVTRVEKTRELGVLNAEPSGLESFFAKRGDMPCLVNRQLKKLQELKKRGEAMLHHHPSEVSKMDALKATLDRLDEILPHQREDATQHIAAAPSALPTTVAGVMSPSQLLLTTSPSVFNASATSEPTTAPQTAA